MPQRISGNWSLHKPMSRRSKTHSAWGGGLGEGEEQGFDAQAEWQEDGDDDDDATAASSPPSPPIIFPDLDEMLGFGDD